MWYYFNAAEKIILQIAGISMRSKKNLQLHHLRPHHDQKQGPAPQHGKRKLQ